jgi:crotonobetainyl-CoA:carnitine CoA-transferase CaiB-like acyl-CoA transferase
MNTTPMSPGRTTPQPLQGLRVIEFTHMVMGPACGLVLADLGAEVIRVEPPKGDPTRGLSGGGAGFFPMFNRNKKSITLDLHHEKGASIARTLCASADVVVENFKPGTMEKYGLDYASLSADNPKLIYAGCKGFLAGPYAHRTALDEVVQMMGGLAYMTGRPGDPLRVGSSVNDIMGGVFAAVAVLGAIIQRGVTGRGMEVNSALYENNVFLVGQHMMQYAVTGKAPSPLPLREIPWAVYDLFTVAEGEQIFLAVVSDAQWVRFCDVLGFPDLKAAPEYASNAERVLRRLALLSVLRERLSHRTASELGAAMEKAGLPLAPVRRPEDLFDDEHLLATGGLADVRLPDGPKAGTHVKTTLLPVSMDGKRLGVRLDLPAVGQHTTEILADIGLSPERIELLRAEGVCCWRDAEEAFDERAAS